MDFQIDSRSSNDFMDPCLRNTFSGIKIKLKLIQVSIISTKNIIN